MLGIFIAVALIIIQITKFGLVNKRKDKAESLRNNVVIAIVLAASMSILKCTKESNNVSYRTQILQIAMFMGLASFFYEIISQIVNYEAKKHIEIINREYEDVYAYIFGAGFFAFYGFFIISILID